MLIPFKLWSLPMTPALPIHDQFITILGWKWSVSCFMPLCIDVFFSMSPNCLCLVRQTPSSRLCCSCCCVRFRHCSFTNFRIGTRPSPQRSGEGLHQDRNPTLDYLSAWESHLPFESLSLLISKVRGIDQMISKFLPALMINKSI